MFFIHLAFFFFFFFKSVLPKSLMGISIKTQNGTFAQLLLILKTLEHIAGSRNFLVTKETAAEAQGYR